jgi:ferredoxin-NAD(P)+ reductase (naphthalene dioxygenase ferredoxin-specific)
MPNKINLIFGGRTEHDLYGLERLAQLAALYKNFQYRLCAIHVTTEKNYFQGLVGLFGWITGDGGGCIVGLY